MLLGYLSVLSPRHVDKHQFTYNGLFLIIGITTIIIMCSSGADIELVVVGLNTQTHTHTHTDNAGQELLKPSIHLHDPLKFIAHTTA